MKKFIKMLLALVIAWVGIFMIHSADFVEAINSAQEVSEFIKSNNWNSKTTKNRYMPIPSFTDDYFCYGHGFDLLTNWEDKFYYLIAGKHDFDSLNEIISVVTNRIPEIDGIITMLSDEAFNMDSNFEHLDTYGAIGGSFGSIDHQSYDNVDNLFEALRKDEKYKDKSFTEIVDEIIFSRKFVIVVDSDECDRFTELYTSGMFEKAGFTKILHGEYIDLEKSYEMTYSFVDIEEEMNGDDEE